MKTLTIGSTTLELKDFRKIRDKVVGVYAQIEIPTTAISYDELKALFTDNQNDLIVADEESTATYSGYAQLDEIREKGGVFTVIQICTSETIHLLNEARKQIEEQSGNISTMQNVISEQNTALENHAKVITEQAEQIVAQNEIIGQQTALVGALEENSVMQMATIESLLLEVIPTVIAETVAEALASNSTTEPEVVE